MSKQRRAIPLKLPSPAKVNQFLHVVGRREDGHHLIETAFQFIDYCDELSFLPRSDDKITLAVEGLELLIEDNLVYRAAHLLRAYTNTRNGVDIHLSKNIPMGSGLGGGSSNAATTLLSLNYLWETRLTIEELLQLGSKLGADVPIFVYGLAAFGQGIGEKLQAIDLPEDWILLLFPGCHVETKKIFSDSQLTRNTPTITITKFLEEGGRNDCEPVAGRYFPQIASAINWLGQFSKPKMTGTGSCVFATFKEKAVALNVAQKVPDSLRGLVVKGLNYSPLHKAIQNLATRA